MAEALRKVSQNYNWTLKRADNDLHNVISGTPRPQKPLLSYPDVKPAILSVSPWDSNRLRWKFRTDYEEFREHLDSAFFILFSWMMSIHYLLRAAAVHFIWHPICSLVRSYEESNKLANLGIRPTSVRGLLVLLFRSAAPLILALLRDIFALSIPVIAKTFTEDKTDTRSASRLSVQPISAHVPVKGPHGLGGAQAPAKDNSVAGITSLLPIASLVIDDLKDRSRMMHTAVHDEARQLSRRKPGYKDPERFLTSLTVPPRVREKVHWDTRYILTFSPMSVRKAVRRRGAAEVVIILPVNDDVPATWVGDEGPVAHDPVSLAL